ncbi:hypothetical protein [Maledivibacter halophilus]|uniref:Uncharacterized protein n=1 Tax=Maledivibacter halophilus TaxID=36842 RepID=A0A1T5MFH2_9FIRM|nr:hypothetical protein [Maledivibacter halophilus]SKC86905.1 hypothetical protein SAMN02194393_04595 [Maledivibacter halophilus]
MFSICSRYIECSKQEFCIHPDEEMKNECRYNLKLKEGFNFYSKSKNKGLFLIINSRMFFIGRRSSYGSYTYDLKDNEKEEVIPKLKEKGLQIENKVRYNLCRNDIASDSNRACCLVILTVDDRKYNIKNFNTRCVTQDTATMIRDYLREKGFLAAVQKIGSTAVNHKIRASEKREIEALKKVNAKENKCNTNKPDVLKGQISMFDLYAI